MSKHKYNSPTSLITRDISKIADMVNGNLYEAVVIISKRARQISAKLKEELAQKLEEFSSGIDTLEEVHENREQIEISKYYERLPKPTTIATDEFLEGKLVFYRAENEEE
ncbi:MAG: DNA-directed RNA polymerase subunit omega [Cytophagales bacterium]|nr:DNA-directed RNA polymerase subunit omega [Bernardetiaceae bacterium]MDW8209580.1 DNA-directed RNA polymerase subunit omega [Cytophagales bacterium]